MTGTNIATMNEVRESLASLRSQEWRIAAVADELGVHRETVSRWHSSAIRPDLVGPVIVALQALSARRRIPKKRRYTKTPPAQES